VPDFDPKEPYNDLPPLPPSTEIETIGVMRSLNLASRALANLNGTALSVPNPQLLIDAFAITEAVASSEIENVNTTSDELFRFMAVGNERASDAT
jgi:Fic family protein